MSLEETIAKEIVERRRINCRTDAIDEAVEFIHSIKRKETLCFDKRVGIFSNDYARYSFWDRVEDFARSQSSHLILDKIKK